MGYRARGAQQTLQSSQEIGKGAGKDHESPKPLAPQNYETSH